MAIPPTIPTSFVPKHPVHNAPHRTSAVNPFLGLAYFVFAVSLVGALVVFGYKFYLAGVAKNQQAQLVEAQKHIDQAVLAELVRLDGRFKQAKSILDRHVVSSQFFDWLEETTLQNVRITTLALSIGEQRTASLDASGVAKSLNTLAAQSHVLATDKKVKHAIFSGISTGKDGLISFHMRADVDASLIVQAPGAQLGVLPTNVGTPAPIVATTTAKLPKSATTTP